MPYFPGTFVRPSSMLSTAEQLQGLNVNMSNGGAWLAANRAIYVGVLVETIVTVTQMAVWPTVQSGNFDVGIYTETGSRLVSAGSTPVGAANTLQAINVADTSLNPGFYFFALCVDNTTAAFQRTANGVPGYYRVLAVQQEAVGAVTLPATATFANPTGSYCPLICATVMSSVI